VESLAPALERTGQVVHDALYIGRLLRNGGAFGKGTGWPASGSATGCLGCGWGIAKRPAAAHRVTIPKQDCRAAANKKRPSQHHSGPASARCRAGTMAGRNSFRVKVIVHSGSGRRMYVHSDKMKRVRMMFAGAHLGVKTRGAQGWGTGRFLKCSLFRISPGTAGYAGQANRLLLFRRSQAVAPSLLNSRHHLQRQRGRRGGVLLHADLGQAFAR